MNENPEICLQMKSTALEQSTFLSIRQSLRLEMIIILHCHSVGIKV